MEIRQIGINDISDIKKLYVEANWQAYISKPDFLEKCYANSLMSYGYYDQNNLLGLIRLVGDGISIIYIQDLIVLNEHKRKNIGTQLMAHVLKQFSGVRQITLLADATEELSGFYTSLGFEDSNHLGMKSYYFYKKSNTVV